MARRSYLQRIAEPLRANDPVLFALPHPAPDEARPAAMNPILASGAVSTTPMLRRAPARAISSPAPVAASGSSVPPAPAAVAPADAVANAMPDAAGTPAFQASSAERHAAAAEPGMRSAPPRSPEPVQAPDESPKPAPAGHRVAGFVRQPPPATFQAAPPSAAFEVAAASPGIAPSGTPDALQAEPARRQPPSPAAPMPNTGSAAPRIHIGTVEVRSAAPPPAPVPPPTAARSTPPAAAPISRGYAWRFGLVQG